MTNTTQQIIKEAKELGYIPEKKYAETQISSTDYGNMQNALLKQRVESYNQAIDSYQLEKIVEFAYEKGREDIIKSWEKWKFGKWFFNRQKKETDKFIKEMNLDIKDIKITNLPNK